MEQYAMRLTRLDEWTYLGGNTEAKKPLECVVRAFGHPLLAVVGESDSTPGDEVIEVPSGEGRRLTGRHFFARPGEPAQACLMSHRGITD